MKMQMLNFLRLGLPLGSCLILCAFVETVVSMYEACMDVISILVIHWNTPVGQFILETPSVMALNVFLFLQIFADIIFMWIGTILKGSRTLLICWIAMTISSVIVLNVVWVHYVYLDGIQSALASAIYTVVLYTLFYAYIVSVACQCVPHMNDNLEELQPIGKGFVCFWKYFCKNAESGTKLLLTSELIINCYFFLSRKLPPVAFDRFYVGHEADMSPPIVLEEMVLRAVRVIVNVVGLVLIYKGKQKMMKYWCIPYLLTLLLSFSVFVYLLAMWASEHEVLTYGYLLYFAINISYRVIIFTVCFSYSQPQNIGEFAFIAEYS